MGRKTIPFYESHQAQSFIDFDLNEWQKSSLHTDQDSIAYLLDLGYSIDDIGLMDAVDILCSRDLEKARQAAALIQHPEAKKTANQSIVCFQDRCIR